MAKKTREEIGKEQDAERQARRRERMREEGIPLTGVVDRVIIEALSFELARTPISVGAVSVGRLLKTARNILSRREGYDREGSAAAVKQRLAVRPEHYNPDHIPSLHPDAGIPVDERARRRAERDIIG
tara:strand:- start:35423 stop:35806 length:384 start_codon:yes stop_codon:yes gene_type:complete